jgi:alpha-L-fucosidase
MCRGTFEACRPDVRLCWIEAALVPTVVTTWCWANVDENSSISGGTSSATMSRRTLLKMMTAMPALRVPSRREGSGDEPLIQTGPFTGTRESLASYRVPELCRNASLASGRTGGRSRRRSTVIGTPVTSTWKGTISTRIILSATAIHRCSATRTSFRPGRQSGSIRNDLVRRCWKAGARYFMSMGVHHDNFDLWDSKYTR